MPGMVIEERVLDLLARPPDGSLWRQSDRQLCEITEHLTALRRAVQVAQWRQLDEMVDRQHCKKAIDITAQWLRAHSELLLADARATVRMAVRMCASPTVLAAYAAADISEREAKYIVDFIAHPPAGVGDQDREQILDQARAFLLLAAGSRNMDTLRAEGEKLREVLSAEPNPGEDLDRNTLQIAKTSHGRVDIRGNFDTETGENLFAALSPFMLPRPGHDGAPDRRSHTHICADAFSELLRHNQPAVGGQVANGVRPRINVHIPIEDLFGHIPTHAQRCQMITAGRIQELLEHTSRGWTQWMGSISLAAAQRLACDCELTMIGADTHGAPLTVNTSRRFASDKHRIGLAGRDRGCAFPHCNRPVSWTQAHHIVPWQHHPSTQIDNLVNLCHYHHVAVHHHGWDVVMGQDRFPVFRPPTQIDPLRRWLASDGSYAQDPPGHEAGAGQCTDAA